MRIHFIGIGGEGMSGLAKLALCQGHSVSGSEINQKLSLRELSSLGAVVLNNHLAEHVEGMDLVVRSSGIPLTHIEVVRAKHIGIRVIKRSECLGQLLRDSSQKMIRIAGSHGKSTTTAMIGSVLQEAEFDPTIIVGAYVHALSSYAVIGSGKYAVVESCEFDSSFLDIPGFATLITSIEPDHLDYYTGGINQVVESFLQFAHQSDQNGIVLVCADNKNIQEKFLTACKVPTQTYGLSSGQWQASIVARIGNVSYFEVSYLGVPFGEFKINVPGSHYVQNALAVIALMHFLEIDKYIIRKGLENYKGVKRRYEKVLDTASVKIIDDYGHTPIEISAVCKAIREEFPCALLICIPCLRQFHRTKRLLKEFSQAFSLADICVIAPIVSGLGDSEDTLGSVSSEDLAEAIRSEGGVAISALNSNEVACKTMVYILDFTKTLVVILTIGSGVSSGVIKNISDMLNEIS